MAGTQAKKIYKVVIIGGGDVGKSCLALRLVHGKFTETHDPTIEDDYTKHNFPVDNELVSIQILDTSGQRVTAFP